LYPERVTLSSILGLPVGMYRRPGVLELEGVTSAGITAASSSMISPMEPRREE
jgi:hypothetical protein